VNHSFLFLCVCVPCELRYYPLYSSLSLSHADPILLPRNHTTCTRRSSCILSFIPHHFNTRLHTTVRLQFPSGSISRNIWFFEPDLLTSEIFFWISSHFKNLVSSLLLTIVSHLSFISRSCTYIYTSVHLVIVSSRLSFQLATASRWYGIMADNTQPKPDEEVD
jgi:hypothetical protein